MALFFSSRASAQQTFGVMWDLPEDAPNASAELEQMAATGVQDLIIPHSFSSSLQSIARDHDMRLYALLPLHFPTAAQMRTLSDENYSEIQPALSKFKDIDQLRALGIFAYGHTAEPGYAKAAASYIKYLEQQTDHPLFYISADTAARASELKINRLQRFASSNSQIIYRFTTPPDQSDSTYIQLPNQLTFYEASWLVETKKQQPLLYQQLQKTGEKIIPKFGSSAQLSHAPYLIISLVAAWALFAFFYNQDPIYRSALFRYISGHRFFVNDVMRRHIRTLLPFGAIVVQYILSAAVLFTIIYTAAFSSLGKQALQVHFEDWLFLGTSAGAIFTYAILLTLLQHLLAFALLMIGSPALRHISQWANLYCWPLQWSLLVTTAALIAVSQSASLWLIMLFPALHLLIWFTAVIITAFDAASYHSNRPMLYVALQLLVLFAITGAALAAYILAPNLHSVLQLAANLPA